MSWKSALVNEGMRFGYKSPKGGPRRITSLAGQSRCLKVWSVIQGNILGYPIDKDTHHGDTGQRGTMKYLRENCYHRIEYSVANSLTALMRK